MAFLTTKEEKQFQLGGTLAVIIFFTGRCDYVGGGKALW